MHILKGFTMNRIFTAFALVLTLTAPAFAQSLPSPKITTQPPESNNDIAASTRFVHDALSNRVANVPVLVGDGSINSLQNTTITAHDIYGPVVPPGWFFFDGYRSAMVVGPTSTVQQGAAYGAYTISSAGAGTPGNEKNAVGYYSLAINAADNTISWGINTACGDNTTNGLATLVGRTCVGYEADFQVNGASTVQGISLIIQGPGTPTGANGLQLSHGSGTARWTNGFITGHGSITNAAAIFGANSESGSNIPSQKVDFSIFDSAGTGHYVQLQAVPFGTDSAFSFRDNIRANGVTFTNSATGSSPQIFPGGTDTNINLTLAGKGSGGVVISSGSSFSQFSTFNAGMKVTGAMIAPFNTPATSSSTCTTGQISVDTTYIYTCVATNTWHRVSNGSTW